MWKIFCELLVKTGSYLVIERISGHWRLGKMMRKSIVRQLFEFYKQKQSGNILQTKQHPEREKITYYNGTVHTYPWHIQHWGPNWIQLTPLGRLQWQHSWHQTPETLTTDTLTSVRACLVDRGKNLRMCSKPPWWNIISLLTLENPWSITFS